MTNKSRRRGKKKGSFSRNFSRSVRRAIRDILLIPGRIPPIHAQTVEVLMKVCETFGVLFVITLVANLISDNTGITVLNVIMGIFFIGLMFLIKLADYQDRLIREQLSHYIYIR